MKLGALGLSGLGRLITVGKMPSGPSGRRTASGKAGNPNVEYAVCISCTMTSFAGEPCAVLAVASCGDMLMTEYKAPSNMAPARSARESLSMVLISSVV